MKTTVDYRCRECDHQWKLDVDYTAADPGRLFGPTEKCWPPSPAEVDLLSDNTCPKCETAVNEGTVRVDVLEQIGDRRDE